mmetsp:Transcript_3701/g.10704  ORF Transcript_3701/g.10704 Transcript_3701/m.10704 type:complete len:231 (+) Transcript_3701:1-693(+)
MTSTLPLAGITSGMQSSGMNYDKLPRDTRIMAPQMGPSPLQQWFSQPTNIEGPPGYEVGHTVRVCHLTAPECARYNSMVGDIVRVETLDNPDGTKELLFDVRCVVDPEALKSKALIRDQEHYKVAVSKRAMAASKANRELIAPMYGANALVVHPDDRMRLPPYVLLYRLPTEKIDPLPGGPPGPGVPMVLPPKWGSPTVSAPQDAYPVGSPQMELARTAQGASYQLGTGV